MSLARRWIALRAALALTWIVVAGCSSQEPAIEDATVPATDADTSADTTEMPVDVFAEGADADVELTDDEVEVIRQLPEEEAEIALAQKVCPITGDPLGEMGVPIKVELEGRPVFLCCAGCKDEATENPAATLAKLPPAASAPSTDEAPAKDE